MRMWLKLLALAVESDVPEALIQKVPSPASALVLPSPRIAS